jgi:hypothetical protein
MVTLGVRTSTYEFCRDKDIQSMTIMRASNWRHLVHGRRL